MSHPTCFGTEEKPSSCFCGNSFGPALVPKVSEVAVLHSAHVNDAGLVRGARVCVFICKLSQNFAAMYRINQDDDPSMGMGR